VEVQMLVREQLITSLDFFLDLFIFTCIKYGTYWVLQICDATSQANWHFIFSSIRIYSAMQLCHHFFIIG